MEWGTPDSPRKSAPEAARKTHARVIKERIGYQVNKKELRDLAEKQYETTSGSQDKTRSEADLRMLVHELGVRRIELEMQNEELFRTQQELEASEKKYRDLYDFAPIGYATLDAEGTIHEINLAGASLIGENRERLIKKPFPLFLAPGCTERFNSFCTRVLASDKTETCEIRLGARDDISRNLEMEGRVIEGPDGNRTIFRAVLIDLTDRELFEYLRQSNRELEQFAYVASHDLREPLRMVTSFSQLLAQRYKGRLDADADEFIGYIVNGAQRMDELVGDFLDYSLVARGKPFVPTDMNAVAQAAIRNLSVPIRETGARIEVGNLPTVLADSQQMEQLLCNLIANAIKFHGRETVMIEIGAVHIHHAYRFSVKDNGIGIDSEYFEKIFDLFKRLHNNEEYQGTGIGLPICRRIVERHKGRIWVESQEGRGSTFFFTIPWPYHHGKSNPIENGIPAH